MISPPSFLRTASSTALFMVGLFLATACGTTVSQATTERAVTPVESEAPAPVAPGGHEYGTSIEDWGNVDAASPDDTEELARDDTEDAEPVRSDYAEIEWADLIPPGMAGDEIFARYEERFDDLASGSTLAESLYDEMLEEMDSGAANTELDGQKVRLAGFVAPLTYEGDVVTEFLLVPNFGACIHVPPPPPNQTIMVSVDKADGLTLEEAWGPVWVEGTIAVSAEVTDLASASYVITSATSGVYDDF